MFRRLLALIAVLAIACTQAGHADTNNRDPAFAAPLGYAKVTSFLGTSTYLSARPRRLLVADSGEHYLVGTGQTAIGVSPAQSAITVASLDGAGQLNNAFFGTGRRAFKLAPGGQLTDTVVEDAVLVPGVGIAIVGRFVGAPGGYILVLGFSGNPVPSFGGGTGVRYFTDMQPKAVAVDSIGIYVVGLRDAGAQRTDLRIYAMNFFGFNRNEWGSLGVVNWGYRDNQMRDDYDDIANSMAVTTEGRVLVVGSTRRPNSNQGLGYIAVFAQGGLISNRAFETTPCSQGASTDYEFTRVITAGTVAYAAFRSVQDNSTCIGQPRSVFGVMRANSSAFDTSLLAQTNTRSSCCGGDFAELAVTDLARDVEGRLYLSFSTGFPGNVSRGHLVRFNPQITPAAPDPSFGDAGFGTYNLDSPGADATLTAISMDTQQRMVAAGGYTTDILGNPFNVDHWAFRIRDDRVFDNGFE